MCKETGIEPAKKATPVELAYGMGRFRKWDDDTSYQQNQPRVQTVWSTRVAGVRVVIVRGGGARFGYPENTWFFTCHDLGSERDPQPSWPFDQLDNVELAKDLAIYQVRARAMQIVLGCEASRDANSDLRKET